MPHEHVYGICENKCLVEVESKANTDAVKQRVETLENTAVKVGETVQGDLKITGSFYGYYIGVVTETKPMDWSKEVGCKSLSVTAVPPYQYDSQKSETIVYNEDLSSFQHFTKLKNKNTTYTLTLSTKNSPSNYSGNYSFTDIITGEVISGTISNLESVTVVAPVLVNITLTTSCYGNWSRSHNSTLTLTRSTEYYYLNSND